jgi:hypothetical protein
MSSVVTGEVVVTWLTRFHDIVTKQRAYLTELDSAIGDADHGVTMESGLTAVVARLTPVPQERPADVLTQVGDILQASLGGAAGPLYSALFHGAGTELARQYGSEYETYRRAVPGWLPRLTPWRGSLTASPPSAMRCGRDRWSSDSSPCARSCS